MSWESDNFCSVQWKGKMELHLFGCLLRYRNLPLQGRGLRPWYVCRILVYLNLSTRVTQHQQSYLKLISLDGFIFSSKNCPKDTPLGWEEISLSRGFDSSEIQRSSLLRETRGLPAALWKRWGGGNCPIAMRTGRKCPHWPMEWRQCPAGRVSTVWNSFTADLGVACSLSSLPQGKNSLWHWLEKRLQIAGGAHLT